MSYIQRMGGTDDDPIFGEYTRLGSDTKKAQLALATAKARAQQQANQTGKSVTVTLPDGTSFTAFPAGGSTSSGGGVTGGKIFGIPAPLAIAGGLGLALAVAAIATSGKK